MSYAYEIACKIQNLVTHNCQGCATYHGPQRQHDCLMMSGDERTWQYFELL